MKLLLAPVKNEFTLSPSESGLRFCFEYFLGSTTSNLSSSWTVQLNRTWPVDGRRQFDVLVAAPRDDQDKNVEKGEKEELYTSFTKTIVILQIKKLHKYEHNLC